LRQPLFTISQWSVLKRPWRKGKTGSLKSAAGLLKPIPQTH
jgi:hypothetical protein